MATKRGKGEVNGEASGAHEAKPKERKGVEQDSKRSEWVCAKLKQPQLAIQFYYCVYYEWGGHLAPLWSVQMGIYLITFGHRTQRGTQASGNEGEEERGHVTMDRHRGGLGVSSRWSLLLLQLC